MAKITKTQLKELYHKIDDRIVRRITALGLSEKSTLKKHPELPATGEGTYKNLLKMAQKYDVEAFFVLRRDIRKRDMKPGYKILLKAYQKIRNGGIALVKKIYKLRYD